MKKSFFCSLCHNGIIGGALYILDSAITYKTGKLTVAPAYRSLSIPLREIFELTWKWRLFPVATFRLTDGRSYTFIIFNQRRFQKYFEQARNALSL